MAKFSVVLFATSTDYRDYRSLSDLTIGILGLGDIGKDGISD